MHQIQVDFKAYDLKAYVGQYSHKSKVFFIYKSITVIFPNPRIGTQIFLICFASHLFTSFDSIAVLFVNVDLVSLLDAFFSNSL